jgi:hypothetical protein
MPADVQQAFKARLLLLIVPLPPLLLLFCCELLLLMLLMVAGSFAQHAEASCLWRQCYTTEG